MDLRSVGPSSMPSLSSAPLSSMQPAASAPDLSGEPSELREAFTDFVGQTLFGSMLTSMRKTVGKPAYMHGGRTEEVFQEQMDQHIVEDLTKSSAHSIADPMFDLFNMQRRS
ncbi:Rod binding protein [Rubripirellula tenax]|uniref:Rod binding protein n=1 Tax=Rubripirellula tenax TaxID=2528015 RepID=A0A5C6FG93_9BACT|nr:rod-binding protein [Rubripirellula tenax]TWU59845.1 Rod binding protein [Rubripirellula tenax]